ncbi:MAG: alpha/beta fold hydrolase [Pseudonocardiaceae bacterium]|nr:alpha/beta fold hydrolase [Pseudonocardiaceae bacterium]
MTVGLEHGVATDLDVRGSSVRMRSGGSGAPVVYLHGAGDLGDWLPVHDRLASSYTVYRPDLPGFNHSQRWEQIDSTHDMAYAVLDILDALGLHQVRLIGSSLGGWVAADLATIEPDRVSHLVLVDPAGLRPDGGHPVDMFAMSPTEILERTYHTPELRERVRAAAAERESDPDAFLLLLRNRAATAKLAWNPYFHDVKLPGRLHRIRARTQIIWGSEDQLLPAELGQKFTTLIPHANLHLVPECGHLPQIEQPDHFLDAVLPFFES